jgi:hypothetical protein
MFRCEAESWVTHCLGILALGAVTPFDDSRLPRLVEVTAKGKVTPATDAQFLGGGTQHLVLVRLAMATALHAVGLCPFVMAHCG